MITVHAVTWGPATVTIAYSDEDDLRDVAGSPVLLTKQLVLDAAHPSFIEVTELHEAAVDLVADVLQEFRTASKYEAPTEDDDDDEG